MSIRTVVGGTLLCNLEPGRVGAGAGWMQQHPQPLWCSSGLALIFSMLSAGFRVILQQWPLFIVAAPSNPARRGVYPERKPQAHKSSGSPHATSMGERCAGLKPVPFCPQPPPKGSSPAPCGNGSLWPSVPPGLASAPAGQSRASLCQLSILLARCVGRVPIWQMGCS